MEDLSSLFKTLGDQNRLRILALLQKRPMCVCELACVLQITQPSVSKHLRKLEAAGLVLKKQESFWTNYSLRSSVRTSMRSLLGCVLGQLSRQGQARTDLLKAKDLDRKKLCNQ